MSADLNNSKKFFDLALKSHKENKLSDAEKFYCQALELNPSHFDAIFYLASLYAQVKNLIKSKDLFEKAIQLRPSYALTYSNLGAVLKELGKFEEAVIVCKKSIKLQPNNADTMGNLGAALKELGKLQEAVTICQQAIKIDPNNLAAHLNLALTLIEQGEIQQAIDCYKKLSEINSNPAKFYQNLGQLYVVLGNKKEAIKYYQLAIKYQPENLNNYYHLSDLDNKILNTDLKKNINKIILKDKNKNNLAYANFLLSKYESNSKNYEMEFNYLLKAHSHFLDSEKKEYKNDIEYWLNVLPNNKQLNSLKIIDAKVQKDKSTATPIFIVGVPRCGSTLVEKIIGSGSQNVVTGEEIGAISILVKQNIIKKKSVYERVNDIKIEILEKYKQKKLIQNKNNYIFTDKTLDNFFYIGLIIAIFPQAKVINCKRNALSSIMSIIKNNLVDVPWAHNIEHIFKYFDIYYRTIAHYEKTFPNFIYSLDYEKLVNDPETESKKLMDFCDLPWDKKCLEFYKRKDLISKTASNVQIRQAIYKDSIKKYLPYKKFLDKYGEKYLWYNKK